MTVKINTRPCFPARIIRSVSGHSCEQSVARSSSWSIVSQLKVSPRLYQTDLRISNHRGHKFPPSLTLLSFKTRIEWPPRLTETASFQSLCFQLLQCSRQRPSFSAHRAALMTKSDLTFPAFSLRSVDFAVEFWHSWQWCDFPGFT